MKRLLRLAFGCGLLVQLASCNTFDDPGRDISTPESPPPPPRVGRPAFIGAGAPAPLFDAGRAGFGPVGAAGFGAAGTSAAGSGGRGGWQLFDGGVPPANDADGGYDDAGR